MSSFTGFRSVGASWNGLMLELIGFTGFHWVLCSEELDKTIIRFYGWLRVDIMLKSVFPWLEWVILLFFRFEQVWMSWCWTGKGLPGFTGFFFGSTFRRDLERDGAGFGGSLSWWVGHLMRPIKSETSFWIWWLCGAAANEGRPRRRRRAQKREQRGRKSPRHFDSLKCIEMPWFVIALALLLNFDFDSLLFVCLFFLLVLDFLVEGHGARQGRSTNPRKSNRFHCCVSNNESISIRLCATIENQMGVDDKMSIIWSIEWCDAILRLAMLGFIGRLVRWEQNQWEGVVGRGLDGGATNQRAIRHRAPGEL